MSFETRKWNQIQVGEALPELSFDVDTTSIVAGAMASRDYTPVHHDRKLAQAQGLQDIIMNTYTTQGLVVRFVTDWAGIDAVVKHMKVKLGVPTLPGQTLKVNGSVAEKDESQGTVLVNVTGTNSWGDHVTGSVTIALPKGA